MRIQLVTVGTRVPDWVDAGFQDYARRLPPQWRLQLKTLRAPKRRILTAGGCIAHEGDRLLAAVPPKNHVVALHKCGGAWGTEELAARIGQWFHAGRDIALIIGGPDGLAPACLARANEQWSLSRLTLPHALVRVIVVEQLYRASTIIRGHPYHRA